MAETPTVPPAAPKRKFAWLRWLGIILGIVVVLLVAAYFVGTSSWFLKSVILPRAGKTINATITVSDASISPFSQVILRNLWVKTTGAEPLVAASEVRLRYDLMKIMRGNIKVDEVAVVSPILNLVENQDGSSNLDPVLKSQQKPSQPEKPSEKPLQLDIAKITVSDGKVSRTKLYSGANRDTAEISKFNLAIENVKNGQTGKLTTSAEIAVQNNPPAPDTNGMLQAKLDGNFTFALTSDLKPGSVQGTAKVDVARAAGAFAQANGFSSEFNVDMTPTDIKQLLLRITKGAAPLAELRASGPFNMEKAEGQLTVTLQGVDKQLFNLFGANQGMDFGTTRLGSTNQIQLTQGGKVVTASGRLALNSFQVIRTNLATPALDLSSDYDLTVDLARSNAVVRVLNILGNQQQSPLLSGSLDRPMPIAWGNVTNAVGDSVFTLRVLGFNFADWKAFLGDVAPAGVLTAEMNVTSQQAGKLISFNANSRIKDMVLLAASNRIDQAGIVLQANGKATDLKQFDLAGYKFQFEHRNQPVMIVSGAGTYNLETTNADMQISAQAALDRLATMLPDSGLSLASGSADANVRLTQKGNLINVLGNVAVTNLTGSFASNQLTAFATSAELDLGMNTQEVQLRKFAGRFSESGKPGGSYELSASYGLTNSVSRFNAKLSDINENAVRPFVQPYLGDKKLVSVAINGAASGRYDPLAASDLKADMQVEKLVVSDPANKFPATPLEAGLSLDTTLNKQVADIRVAQLRLSPTDLARTNAVNLTGRVDMTKTNAIQGNLKLTADTLDFTRYYDIFEPKTSTASTTGPVPAKPVASTRPGPAPVEKEPEPVIMPFSNFVAEASIGKVYLREIQITNIQTTLKLDRAKVSMKPFQLALNGAPVTSTLDLDMGVPGYKYAFDVRAVQMPLAPVMNSFVPDRKDQVGGTLTGVGEIKGAGATGPNLAKNLSGKFDIGTTNLNLAIPTLRSKLMKTIINVIAVVPELKKNPNAALGTLTGALFGAGSSSQRTPGFTDELMNSPLDVIQARGTIGNGQVELTDSLVQSPAFQAGAHGTIRLADVLTNSALNIPISVALRRSLAEKINFVPAGTPTNVAYVKLPDYVTVEGTLGDPKEKINKVALLGTALQQIGSSIPGVDQKTGALLQNLGSVLTGRQGAGDASNVPQPTAGTNQPGVSAATNAPASSASSLLQGLLGTRTATNAAPSAATNQPGRTATTNTSPASALIQGLGDLLGNRSTTNRVGTNQPGTNANPVGSLLDQLLNQPKKK